VLLNTGEFHENRCRKGSALLVGLKKITRCALHDCKTPLKKEGLGKLDKRTNVRHLSNKQGLGKLDKRTNVRHL
jgi:hypothetical protein